MSEIERELRILRDGMDQLQAKLDACSECFSRIEEQVRQYEVEQAKCAAIVRDIMRRAESLPRQ